MKGGGMYLIGSSSPPLTNSILWGNSPEEIYYSNVGEENSITITYSDIQGGEAEIVTNDNGTVYWLGGNIDADPLFTDPENRDFTLQADSPCIDAGTSSDLSVDLKGTSRPNGAGNDIGCYEFE